MGLRINSDGARGILSQLQQSSKQQNRIYEQLSSGLRINRASDDPSGLVISEILRSQLGSLDQAINNTERAGNLLNTADAALDEGSRLVTDLRRLTIQGANAGSTAEKSAIQSQINSIVSSLDRIGATTRFGTQNLLDGSAAIQTKNVDAAFVNVNVNSNTPLQADQTVNVDVTAAATQANVAIGATGAVFANTDSTIKIQGADGTATFTLGAGATGQDFINAVNQYSAQTGVTAVDNAGTVELQSQDYGSNAIANLNVVSGNFAPGNQFAAQGTDLQGTVNGQAFAAQGNNASLQNGNFNVEFEVAAGTGPGSYTFDIAAGTGTTVQTGINATDNINLSIQGLSSATLGEPGTGSLASLTSGGANDIFSGNLDNQLAIIDGAAAQISSQRSQIGAFQSQTLDSNYRSLSVAFENLSASQSQIRDLDFAQGVLEKFRAETQREAGIRVLRSLNLNRQSVLQLLQ